jgi:hypothetical protein
MSTAQDTDLRAKIIYSILLPTEQQLREKLGSRILKVNLGYDDITMIVTDSTYSIRRKIKIEHWGSDRVRVWISNPYGLTQKRKLPGKNYVDQKLFNSTTEMWEYLDRLIDTW